MKKILFFNIILIILCLCSCEPKYSETEINNSHKQEEKISDKLVNDIESEYEKESQKQEYITTAGMIELAYKYADKWDSVSEEYYNKITELAGNEKNTFKEKLADFKTSYDEYIKNNLDVYAEIYNSNYPGGSIVGPLCASKYYELKKDYALEFINIYEEMVINTTLN